MFTREMRGLRVIKTLNPGLLPQKWDQDISHPARPPLPDPAQHHHWLPALRRSCHPLLQSSYQCLGSDLKADSADATAKHDAVK